MFTREMFHFFVKKKIAFNGGAPSVYEPCSRVISELAQRRQGKRHKTKVLMSKNNRSARVIKFLYISLPSSAKQQREMIQGFVENVNTRQ